MMGRTAKVGALLILLVILGRTSRGAIDLGQYPSLALDPVTSMIVVVYGSQYGLKITSCQPDRCQNPSSRHLGCTPPLAAASLTYVDQRPFIAFSVRQPDNNPMLFGLHCHDQSCQSYDSNQIGENANSGYAATVVNGIADLPLISYLDRHLNQLAIASCLDLSCCNHQISYPAPLGGVYGSAGSTDIVMTNNGTAIISFQTWSLNGTSGALQLAICRDGTCQNNVQLIELDQSAAEFTSITTDTQGNPMVAYVDITYTILRLAVCDQPDCQQFTVYDLFPSTGPSSTPVLLAWPVIRVTPASLPDGMGLPIIAFLVGLPSGGGQLLLLFCKTSQCQMVQHSDVVLVDDSPLWSPANMQISMILRSTDGRPVISYSVSEQPAGSSHLKVAICDTSGCVYSSAYDLDNDIEIEQVMFHFNTRFAIWAELILLCVSVLAICAGRYTPNKARLVHAYTLLPFTSEIVVNVRYRHTLGLCLILSCIGATITSFSWVLYCGAQQFSAYWQIFFLSFLPVGTSLVAYVTMLQCDRTRLISSAAACLVTILVALNVILTYAINSETFECNTINVYVPRLLTCVGVLAILISHLIGLFLCVRIHTALGLAQPALLHSIWEDDL